MGGRGESSGGGRIGGGGLNPNNIKSTDDMISARGEYQGVDQVLQVAREMREMYGENSAIQQFQIADIKGKDELTVIGYYDGANIAINQHFMDQGVVERAYDQSVKDGYHPSKGSRTAIEAVAAHEYGHALTDAAAKRMGESGLDRAATRIVTEARKDTGHRGVVQMASKISKYATKSNAEAVAEAVADVFCNGTRATAESRAIVRTLNKYTQ